MALAAINVKKPREAQIGNCCTGNPVLRILPDSMDFAHRFFDLIFCEVKGESKKTQLGKVHVRA